MTLSDATTTEYKNNQQDSKTASQQTQDYVGRKQYSTFNLTVFLLKVVLAVISVYLGIALGYAAFLPYSYSRDRDNFAHTLATSAMQPAMDVVGSGKVSHYYDWREIPSSDIAEDIFTLKIRSGSPQIQNYDSVWTQLYFDIGINSVAREAVVLEPETYKDSWSLVKCSAVYDGSNQKICLRSNLTHKGAIRYAIDGNTEVWGVDRNGRIISLKTVNYINIRDDRTKILI